MLLLIEKIKDTIWVYIFSKIINHINNGNSDSKVRSPKFISFSLLINQDILSDLQIQF